MHFRQPWFVSVVISIMALSGCRTRLYETVQITLPEVITSCRQQETQSKVDALFMVDNSTSMDDMQTELRTRFPQFLQVFSDLAATGTFVDLHIGVVTSDYGAGSTGTGGCQPSPGGQKGMLQAIGQFAAPGCLPPVGANYLTYNFDPAQAGANNLPPFVSLADEFTCMASVGSRGCGMEHQLESVYVALHNGLPENAGFLRDDAVLVIAFLTNEDDASAPTDSNVFDNTLWQQDYIWNGINEGPYGLLSSYSRQTRFAIMCGDPLAFPPYGDSMGPLADCQAAPNPNGMGPGKQYDVSRYINYFSQPSFQGGLKFDPTDLLLVAIAAPPTPFQTILAVSSTGNNGQPYTPCPAIAEMGNPQCLPVLQHSCQNSVDPAFFGDPAVRINTVLNSVANHSFASICDSNYSTAMQNIGKLVASQLGSCCLPSALPSDPRVPNDPASVIAQCTVQQITRADDGTATTTPIPQCVMGGTFPCWQIEQKDECGGLSPQGIGITVERNGQAVPPHTTAQATCTGVPS